jgi:hypothetical protein
MNAFCPPSGWPVVEPGLFMGHIGPVLVVYCDARISDGSFDRQCVELARAIDLRQGRVGVLYDVPSVRSMDARRRRRLAELLDARRERLALTTAAFALVTSSPVVRGMLRAVFWLAPPPYPHVVTSTPREGFDFVAGRLACDAPSILDQKYADLLRRHDVRMRVG